LPFWSGLGFQNLLGLVLSQLESLHDLIIVWLVVIIRVVTFISLGVFINSGANLGVESEALEKTWTLVPILILVSIAIPSIHLLCVQDTLSQTPTRRVKVIRNQWNWQRELIEEDSRDHVIDVDALDSRGSYEVPRIIDLGVVRFVVVSTDVLHSLGVPRIGVKLDSAPGRLNIVRVDVFNPSLYTGGCYELCGRGHRAMPITILAI